MLKRISPDATVRDVVSTLRDPIEYVRMIVSGCHDLRRQNIEEHAIQVRIGKAGRGIIPNYRIEAASEFDMSNGPPDTIYKFHDVGHFEVFHGSSHKVIKDSWADTNWSNEVMTLRELEILLGDLRARAKDARK